MIARLENINQRSAKFLKIRQFITRMIKQIVAIIDTKRLVKYVSKFVQYSSVKFSYIYR
jgi:transcriptional regulatory protein LevR